MDARRGRDSARTQMAMRKFCSVDLPKLDTLVGSGTGNRGRSGESRVKLKKDLKLFRKIRPM